MSCSAFNEKLVSIMVLNVAHRAFCEAIDAIAAGQPKLRFVCLAHLLFISSEIDNSMYFFKRLSFGGLEMTREATLCP